MTSPPSLGRGGAGGSVVSFSFVGPTVREEELTRGLDESRGTEHSAFLIRLPLAQDALDLII